MSTGSLMFFDLFLFWGFLGNFADLGLTAGKKRAGQFLCQKLPATLMLAMRNHLNPVIPPPSLILQFTAVSVSDGQAQHKGQPASLERNTKFVCLNFLYGLKLTYHHSHRGFDIFQRD